jgi:hypothetical protein
MDGALVGAGSLGTTFYRVASETDKISFKFLEVYHSLIGGHIICLVIKAVLFVCHVKISQTSLHSWYIGKP